MALGVPVITSFCSKDARNMCSEGAALGFEVGDHGRLTLLLQRVLSEKALRQDLVARARTCIARHELSHALPEHERFVLDAIAMRRRVPSVRS